MTEPLSVREFLGAYKAPRLTAHVTTRADLLGEITALAHELELERSAAVWALNPPPEHTAKRDRLNGLVKEMAASEMAFTFEAISNASLEVLKASCPPTPSQVEAGMQWDPVRYCPALIHRCAVEPVVSIEEAIELSETLTESQFVKLWQTAAAVNIGSDEAPKLVRFSEAEDPPETSSASPMNSVSPEASSSAG